MKHSFIDGYSHIESPLKRLDPRIKIAAFSALIVSIILAGPGALLSYGLFALVIFILVLVSRIPPLFFIKRAALILPFVLLTAIFIPFLKAGEPCLVLAYGPFQATATREGFVMFRSILLKGFLSIVCLTLLTAATPFADLLKALEKLKFPSLMIMLLSFMYRYIFIIHDEILKMKQAREARMISGSTWRFRLKAVANMTGVLFIRSFERAESVHLAMCSRGFNGQIRTLYNFQIRFQDMLFILILAAALIGINLFGF
ncbi:MAG: cobalt ECF transporter T component CbiQ [Syntrophales bacterium]